MLGIQLGKEEIHKMSMNLMNRYNNPYVNNHDSDSSFDFIHENLMEQSK